VRVKKRIDDVTMVLDEHREVVLQILLYGPYKPISWISWIVAIDGIRKPVDDRIDITTRN